MVVSDLVDKQVTVTCAGLQLLMCFDWDTLV
jgi:hypothetical protein